MSKLGCRIVAFLVGVVFLGAGLVKAADSEQPRVAIRYALGEGWDGLVFVALVVGEILLGAALIAGIFPRATLFMAIVVLALFLSWLAYLQAVGAEISCGCGVAPSWLQPGEERMVGLIRNSILILGAGMALYSWTRQSPSDSVYVRGDRS